MSTPEELNFSLELFFRSGTIMTAGTSGQGNFCLFFGIFLPEDPQGPCVPFLKKIMANGFIPLHGGYKNLLTYQKSKIIYDATVYFTGRFFRKGDRTIDQMVQAARSGKQNIIEGSMASGTSKETEIKLTNVARASLEELLEDYRDFLRVKGYSEWPTDHPYAQRLRQINRTPGADYETFRKGIEHENPEISANVILGLTRVCSYLLERQLRQLEEQFLAEGGLRERMTKARIEHRNKDNRKKNG